MTGSGTIDDPYIIWDVNDLQDMALDLGAYYELGCNIDASATSGWNAGLGFAPISPFDGYLDGKNFTIEGLFVNRPAGQYAGLIGYSAGAEISNVVLKDSIIFGDPYAGGLIGRGWAVIDNVVGIDCRVTTNHNFAGGLVGQISSYSTLASCSFTGYVAALDGAQSIGGLVGSWTADGIISDCSANIEIVSYNPGGLASRAGGLSGHLNGEVSVYRSYAIGTIEAQRYVGGLAGAVTWYADSKIHQCYADVNVTITPGYAATFYVGGFIGSLYDDANGEVKDCYARGNVNAPLSGRVGGFIGGHWAETIGETINCYSTGQVIGLANVGGFMGSSQGSVLNCFWDTDTSGQAASAAGTGKTTAEMTARGIFADAGWDFEDVWGIFIYCNDSYPCLRGVTPSCMAPLAASKAYALAREEL